MQKKKKLFYYKKLRLINDYQYESEKEKKEERGQQISKMPDKKERPKKSTKDDWIKLANGLMKKKQT